MWKRVTYKEVTVASAGQNAFIVLKRRAPACFPHSGLCFCLTEVKQLATSKIRRWLNGKRYTPVKLSPLVVGHAVTFCLECLIFGVFLAKACHRHVIKTPVNCSKLWGKKYQSCKFNYVNFWITLILSCSHCTGRANVFLYCSRFRFFFQYQEQTHNWD